MKANEQIANPFPRNSINALQFDDFIGWGKDRTADKVKRIEEFASQIGGLHMLSSSENSILTSAKAALEALSVVAEIGA